MIGGSSRPSARPEYPNGKAYGGSSLGNPQLAENWGKLKGALTLPSFAEHYNKIERETPPTPSHAGRDLESSARRM